VDCSNIGTDVAWGFYVANDIDDVMIDSVSVDNCSIGVHIAACNGSCKNERIVIRNSAFTHNHEQGFLGTADGLVIENNLFEDNGGGQDHNSGSEFNHNLYLNHLNGDARNERVVGNELYRSARSGGECVGGSLTVHGVHTDLVIEGNWIHEDRAAPGCWGIGVTATYAEPETFTRVRIRGNMLQNMGNVAVALSACVDCVVENNVITSTLPYGTLAVAAPAASGPGDATLERLRIRNNSIRLATAAGSTAIRLGDQGSGHQIASNAIQFDGVSGANCFDVTNPAALSMDWNICGGGARWSRTLPTFSQW
jgi:Right handed beta helix region